MQMPAFSGLKYTYLGYRKMKPDQGKDILNNIYDDVRYFDKNDKKHYKIRKNYMRQFLNIIYIYKKQATFHFLIYIHKQQFPFAISNGFAAF